MTTLFINKKQYQIDLEGHETLIEILRDRLNLTGTKTSCQEADCGACTVIINGKAVLSCCTLAKDAEGEEITTIEGLASGENLHPIQQAFLDQGAVQCGFCTPGMIMATKALLDYNPQPAGEDIQYALDGNVCRCTGYLKIFNAVNEAAKVLGGQKIAVRKTKKKKSK